MKKIIACLLIAVLAAIGCFALTACNDKGDKVKVIEVPLTEEEYAFAVGKNDSALLASVNAFLQKIKDDGTLDAVIDKYFDDIPDEGQIEGITSAVKDDSKQQLVVATNAAFPPFEYTIGNKFAGIDLEIGKLLADELGLELVISDMEFDSVIASVNTGASDIGMAALTVNPVRMESVNFSKTYYNASQMIIAKADDNTFDGLTTVKQIEDKLKTLTGKKIGVQSGTTGKFYVAGDEDWGFDGFSNIEVKEYTSGALAVKDLIAGSIDYVVIDEMPAKLISQAFNGK